MKLYNLHLHNASGAVVWVCISARKDWIDYSAAYCCVTSSFLSLCARDSLVYHVRKYFCKTQRKTRKDIKGRKGIQRIKRRKKNNGDRKINWRIIASIAVLLGIHQKVTFKNCFYTKRLTKRRFQLMLTCNKCYNGHHDQCMGKAGMFDCGCECFKK